MASPTPSLASWTASNLRELHEIWQDLGPDASEPGTPRTFRGRELTPEQAGDVFERWLLEAFRISGARIEYGYRVPTRESGQTREQLDGMLIEGWQGFLIEAKFWPGKVDFSPIAVLAAHVEARPTGTLGLFFSPFGYTLPALECAEQYRPIRVLLFQRTDLDWALGVKTKAQFAGRMVEMVKRKWLLALKFGRLSPPVDRAVR